MRRTLHSASLSRSTSGRSLLRTAFRWSLLGALALGSVSCRPAKTPLERSAEDLRRDGRASKDPAVLSEWFGSELLAPGGSPAEATAARARLDELGESGLVAELLRAIEDRAHGRPAGAATHYVRALVRAKTSDDPRAGLFAWFAAQEAYELAGHARDFGRRHHETFEKLLDEPGNIGFRAYGTVVDLLLLDASERADKDVDAEVARRLGCVQHARLAGPFGTGTEPEILRAFPAEKPGAWPARFEGEPSQKRVPRVLETETIGCDVSAKEGVGAGVYYAETFVELAEATEVLLTSSGAMKIFVDDREVLNRDPRKWGVWPTFGVKLGLDRGRHRILVKLVDASTSIRLAHADGRPLAVKSDTAAALGYTLAPPRSVGDPNELGRYLKDGKVQNLRDHLTTFVAARLFDLEGQPDVATVFFEPLIKDVETATGLALLAASRFAERDPIYDSSQTRDLVHELEQRAAAKDAGLWEARLALALWEGEQKGGVAAIQPLVALVKEFPAVPSIYYSLAHIYDDLGWGPEWEEIARGVARQYPDDPDAIALGIEQYETEGNMAKVEELLRRLVEIDPDTNVPLQRALARLDFEAAIAELRRLSARRPDRKDLVDRLEDVLVRSGRRERTLELLEAAVKKEPRDVHARLSLADYAYARGDKAALAKALVSAVEVGSDAGVIEEAIDLVEGMTALEPYRLDARKVIAEYEARLSAREARAVRTPPRALLAAPELDAEGEGQGQDAQGTAVRVLDYGALLVRSDGSSRFLEHEVVHVRSEEGVRQFAEPNAYGTILHLRVLKKDGRVMEPEEVAGKPTVTLPYLEIGDYVEIERIVSEYGDGGDVWSGPTWYFREENVAYERSEFLVVTPRGRALQIEEVGGITPTFTSDEGVFSIRRYRVDGSPAAPSEPNSPPMSEFLPHVSFGWGIRFEDRVRGLSRSFVSLEARDPRLRSIAENIVRDVPETQPIERAKRLYHWVLESVQEGGESDGRRVVVGRNGNRYRGFETLCRSVGIPVRWAVAESRLASPIVGELSSASRPLFPLLVVGEGSDAVWLTIDDRYAPFGTVPSYLRGEKAYLLGDFEAQESRVPAVGTRDGIAYVGRGRLALDGSAELELSIRFLGQFGAGLRNGLAQIPENQLASIIESRLLGQSLQGARLLAHEVIDAERLDQPLTLKVKVEVPRFATPTAGVLLLGPPFMPHLSQMAALSERVTPLLIPDTTLQSVELELELPPGFVAKTANDSGDHQGAAYAVEDGGADGKVRLVRRVETRAGRIKPEEYLDFQAFTRRADSSLGRAVRLEKR